MIERAIELDRIRIRDAWLVRYAALAGVLLSGDDAKAIASAPEEVSRSGVAPFVRLIDGALTDLAAGVSCAAVLRRMAE